MNLEFTESWDAKPDALKVLFLPLNSHVIRQSAVERAFVKLGFNLWSFDYHIATVKKGAEFTNRQFLKVVDFVKPDWIHMQIQFSTAITADTLIKIKQRCKNTIVTNWTGDIRPTPIPAFMDVAKHIDYAFISNTGQLEAYRKAGCNNIDYWQVGYDQTKFRPFHEDIRKRLRTKYSQDIAFCATWWPRTRFSGNGLREDVVNLLHQKYGSRFGIYGRGWKGFGRSSVGYFEQNDVYNASKMVISISQLIDVDNYYSDRQLIAMASGSPVLANYANGLEEDFEDRKDIIWFRNARECLDLVEYYLSHEDEAKKIGVCGAETVLKNHTWDCRILELAQKLGVFK